MNLLPAEPDSVPVPEWAQMVAATLLNTLRERDPYTYGHSRRVAWNATNLAKRLGVNPSEQSVVEFASLFHDLGKIGIPDSILLKPGRLEPHEEAIMRSHPIRSAEILAPLSHIEIFRAAVTAVRSHHERLDGSGYPDGLAARDIPLASRIILIADTYDAMTTTRPYRKGLPREVAYQELRTHSGTQFDAEFVEVFVRTHHEWGTVRQAPPERDNIIHLPNRKKTAA